VNPKKGGAGTSTRASKGVHGSTHLPIQSLTEPRGKKKIVMEAGGGKVQNQSEKGSFILGKTGGVSNQKSAPLISSDGKKRNDFWGGKKEGRCVRKEGTVFESG